VDAAEAFAIGLANRLVPAGEAVGAAQDLARQLAAFPQACLRGDRLSALGQWGKSEEDALTVEFGAAMGAGTLAAEAVDGAARFADGAGRHGSFS
jgi:enoyl-CoA hydratase